MVDMAMISGAMTAFKAARDIATTMIGIHDATVIRAKVTELNAQIASAMEDAISSYSEQLALLKRVDDAEKEVADLKAWNSDKARYSLTRFDPGVFAYMLRPEAANGEPIHELCAGCYENGKKGILQTTTDLRMRRRVRTCTICKTEYAFGPETPRSTQARALADYNPFSGE